MLGYVLPRCLPILYDSVINSFETIVTNYYQMMAFAACKTAEYTSGTRSIAKGTSAHNPVHLLRCIRGLADFAVHTIRKGCSSCVANTKTERGGLFGRNPRLADCISRKAFSDVFSMYPGLATLGWTLRDESEELGRGIPRKRREVALRIVTRAREDIRIRSLLRGSD